MKNILFICTELDSANGICINKIINKMKDEYNVHILTNEISIEGTGSINAHIHYVKPRFSYNLMKKSKSQISELKKNIFIKLSKITNKIKLIITFPIWPWVSPLYTFRMYKKARKISNKYSIDIVISVYSQIDTLIAGKLLKKRNPKIKFVPYFLDGLSTGIGPKIFSQIWLLKRGLKWENFLCTDADLVIMMMASKKNYENIQEKIKFYKKIDFLDIPLIDESFEIENQKIKENHDITLLYAGSIINNIRDPKYCFEVLSKIKTRNVKFNIIGNVDCIDIIEKIKIDSNIRIDTYTAVNHDEMIEIIRNADFCINIGNNNPKVVPSKILEYISNLKPIISFHKSENDYSLIYLQKYEESIYIIENEGINDSAKKIDEFIEKFKEKKFSENSLYTKFYLNTPAAFLESLKKLQEKT